MSEEAAPNPPSGTGLVDITAPYSNDGKANGERVKANTGSTTTQPQTQALAGAEIKVLKEGETAEHRKFGNGKDVSDELAVSAPKRGYDLHPSSTYQGEGDEVADDEWD
ncbi:hypothetical protein TrLO_g12382 [Triparma laevis f. longispina]|uniref:Uncharacterized protein n=1 Tax=Triparma laevis f. longispina TaxID=1714387 RepID=A0A9W7KRR8_9STRA|nr:hypothetical protein TrLO_g12382 [Triparma laevis f. longispina]